MRRWFGAARYAYNQTVEMLTGELLENVGGASVVAGSDGERMDCDCNGRVGRYLRAEDLVLCVRRERGQLTSQ